MFLDSLKLNNCPQQNLIPRWLLVGGTMFLAHLFFNKIASDRRVATTIAAHCINLLLSAFHLIWFILGW